MAEENGGVRVLDRKNTQTFLLSLGANVHTQGFLYLAWGIDLVAQSGGMRRGLHKQIYAVIAERAGVSVAGVDSSIRREIKYIWAHNREAVVQIFGYPVDHQPTPAEFIYAAEIYLR